MSRRRLHALATAASSVIAMLLLLPMAPAHAAPPGVLVFPGMEIRLGTNVCTLGFVEPQTRVAFTAGHCRAGGEVTDRNGNVIGHLAMWRDNTPDGATVTTDHQISDWGAIHLTKDVVINDILPGGRQLVADPSVLPAPGSPVCHFGVVTGESCGNIESINNGWFTMGHGVVSQKGDSGGPVYVIGPDGRATIIGMFNSTWGHLPAAVGWHATQRQINEEVVRSTSARLGA